MALEEKNSKLSLKLSREKDFNSIIALGEALSSPVRLNILKHLQVAPFIKTVFAVSRLLRFTVLITVIITSLFQACISLKDLKAKNSLYTRAFF